MFIIKTAKGLLQGNNVPYVTCDKDCLIGETGSIDFATKKFIPATDANGAKTGCYVVWNRVDIPETMDTTKYVVPTGTMLRCLDLRSIVGLQTQVSNDLFTSITGIAKGDYIVFDTNGKWIKVADRTAALGYSIFIRIQEMVPMGWDKGFEGVIERGATL